MATTTLTLDGDVTTNWDTTTGANHYGEIDEDPSTPNDSDYIETTTLNDDDEFTLSATPANHDLTSQIVVNIRGQITDSGGTAKIRLELFHSAGTPVTGNPKDCVGSDFGGYGTLGTTTKTWTGLSLTKAQMDSLQLRATFLGS